VLYAYDAGNLANMLYNSAKTVKSLALPKDLHIVLLSIILMP
jgi:hypothetical protein